MAAQSQGVDKPDMHKSCKKDSIRYFKNTDTGMSIGNSQDLIDNGQVGSTEEQVLYSGDKKGGH